MRQNGPSQPPAWWAKRGVYLCADRLPWTDRIRYRQELLAELYGMSSREQLKQTIGVLVMTPALRKTVRDRHANPAPPSGQQPSRSLRCRLRRHAWVARSNELGEHYFECRRCHKFNDPTPITGPPGRGWASG